jgi:hypothetical protein
VTDPLPGRPTPPADSCSRCGGMGTLTWPSEDGGSPLLECGDCKGTGKRPPLPTPPRPAVPEPCRCVHEQCGAAFDHDPRMNPPGFTTTVCGSCGRQQDLESARKERERDP